MTSHEFPALRGFDAPCDVLWDRDSPEISAGDTTLLDPHRWPAFDPSQYVTLGRCQISDGVLSVLRNDESR
jgi:hypothetical protein